MTEVIVGFLILLGAVISLIATFGAIRFPDVYTRNHAISKSTTLSAMLILLGTFFYFVFEGHFNSRVLLAIVFIFMTAPVSGHLIARAAYNSGVKLADRTVTDELLRDRKSLEKENSL